MYDFCLERVTVEGLGWEQSPEEIREFRAVGRLMESQIQVVLRMLGS